MVADSWEEIEVRSEKTREIFSPFPMKQNPPVWTVKSKHPLRGFERVVPISEGLVVVIECRLPRGDSDSTSPSLPDEV